MGVVGSNPAAPIDQTGSNPTPDRFTPKRFFYGQETNQPRTIRWPLQQTYSHALPKLEAMQRTDLLIAFLACGAAVGTLLAWLWASMSDQR